MENYFILLFNRSSFYRFTEIFQRTTKNKDRHYHLLGSGFTLWFVWQLSTIAGIVLGEVIPKELNLAFAVPLTFISLIIVDIKNRSFDCRNYFRNFAIIFLIYHLELILL